MSKIKYDLSNTGSFTRLEGSISIDKSYRVYKNLEVKGSIIDLYSTEGKLVKIDTPEDLYFIKKSFGSYKTTEEYPLGLEETIEVGSVFVLFENNGSFVSLSDEDDGIVIENFKSLPFTGNYYYDLHESKVVNYSVLPRGYTTDASQSNEYGLPAVYDPNKTIKCPICGSDTVSKDSCSCRQEAEDIWSNSDRGLNSYDYTPSFEFRRLSGTEPTFGIELEMEAPSKRSHPRMTKAFRDYDFLYLMSDGSLPELGVEMASHPFSFNWYKQERDAGKDMLKIDYIKEIGMKTKDCSSAGLHIHISKDSFESDEHFDYWYRLMTCNILFLEKISGRTCGGYNQACNFPAGANKKIDDATNRTDAIANRGKTIEFRMMKSDADKVYFGIEMLHATIEFAKKQRRLVGWTRFKKFLSVRKETYPNLVSTFIDKKVPKGLYTVAENNEDWLSDYSE